MFKVTADGYGCELFDWCLWMTCQIKMGDQSFTANCPYPDSFMYFFLCGEEELCDDGCDDIECTLCYNTHCHDCADGCSDWGGDIENCPEHPDIGQGCDGIRK